MPLSPSHDEEYSGKVKNSSRKSNHHHVAESSLQLNYQNELPLSLHFNNEKRVGAIRNEEVSSEEKHVFFGQRNQNSDGEFTQLKNSIIPNDNLLQLNETKKMSTVSNAVMQQSSNIWEPLHFQSSPISSDAVEILFDLHDTNSVKRDENYPERNGAINQMMKSNADAKRYDSTLTSNEGTSVPKYHHLSSNEMIQKESPNSASTKKFLSMWEPLENKAIEISSEVGQMLLDSFVTGPRGKFKTNTNSNETVEPFRDEIHVDSDVQIEKNKENRTRKKRKKDPNKPKQPRSAYNFFFHDVRAKIVAEKEKEFRLSGANEEAPLTSDNDQPQLIGNESKGGKRKRGRPRIRPFPTRRPPHGKISFQDLAKNVAAKWKSIIPEVRERYKKLAQADRERYDRELNVFAEEQIEPEDGSNASRCGRKIE